MMEKRTVTCAYRVTITYVELFMESMERLRSKYLTWQPSQNTIRLVALYTSGHCALSFLLGMWGFFYWFINDRRPQLIINTHSYNNYHYGLGIMMTSSRSFRLYNYDHNTTGYMKQSMYFCSVGYLSTSFQSVLSLLSYLRIPWWTKFYVNKNEHPFGYDLHVKLSFGIRLAVYMQYILVFFTTYYGFQMSSHICSSKLIDVNSRSFKRWHKWLTLYSYVGVIGFICYLQDVYATEFYYMEFLPFFYKSPGTFVPSFFTIGYLAMVITHFVIWIAMHQYSVSNRLRKYIATATLNKHYLVN